mmetsp:Transcript_3596/g.8997  ORF Transcript_3596/g.8997 Transcript_3596/m.8997 type:complete len:187 (-) Transcript_3596:104-664(-)
MASNEGEVSYVEEEMEDSMEDVEAEACIPSDQLRLLDGIEGWEPEDYADARGGRGGSTSTHDSAGTPKKGGKPGGGKRDQASERKKGIPWTEEEHRLFLLGLEKFGKGDWRSISRNFVVSRTPTQVASHAQKYFIRLSSMNKRDKRRASIHDITSVNQPDPHHILGGKGSKGNNQNSAPQAQGAFL